MEWCSGPLAYLLGIPSFWVARFAKCCQFLAGLYIVIEIVGERRIRKLSKWLLRLLRGTKVGRQLGSLGSMLAAHLEEATGIPLLSSVGLGYAQKTSAGVWFPRLVLVWSVVLAGAFAGYVTFRSSEPSQMGYVGMVAIGAAVFVLIGLPGSLAGLIVTAYTVEIGFRSLEASIEGVTRFLVGLLRRRPLSYTLLIASAVFFVIGSILELLAS